MTLKDRIKELANQRGISLPVLESELGFGNGTIVKWDKSIPNAEKLQAVANFFNVSMEYLLSGIKPNDDDIAKDDSERRLLMLCRNASNSPEDRKAIIEHFESTIDFFLKAKGIIK